MLRIGLKIVLGLIGVGVLLAGAAAVLGLYVTRKLPWQHPVFDTVTPADPGTIGEKGVLIFSKTNGFRHASIEAGIAALKNAGRERGWDVHATENGAFFTDDYLSRFKVVIFLSTTGDILTPEQQRSFERFVASGGGYAGIHSASDTEYAWPWYGQLLGTYFRDHTLFPEQTPEAEIITETRQHPATRHLPGRWKKVDEWYNFQSSVRGKAGINVLLSVNDSSYRARFPKAMNGDHPISWTNTVGRGRAFYTGLGHTDETFTNPRAFPHIVNGIAWAGKL